MSVSLPDQDRRVTALRSDLASRALEGVLPATVSVDPALKVARAAAAGLHAAPDAGSEQQDQLLFGEGFEVLDEAGGWAWGQARRDGYVGYVRAEALAPAGAPATHRVAAIRTYAFAEPSIKSRALGPYSLNALVATEATDGRFAKAEGSGWFVAEHLAPIGVFEIDPAAVAERYLGAPYLWGGRESLGLDCSGLVQQALLACGRACPRDTDQQQGLGHAVEPEDLQRGDLVFWRGHVAMMLDAVSILHANAFHMAVVAEPLAQAIVRIAAGATGEPVAYRRP
jgi:cell wall-associated NlpC family hydrolase